MRDRHDAHTPRNRRESRLSVAWDGITGAGVLGGAQVASRHALADAVRDGDWSTMLDRVTQLPGLVNATRHGRAGRRLMRRCIGLLAAGRRKGASPNCCGSARGACCATHDASARSISRRSAGIGIWPGC